MDSANRALANLQRVKDQNIVSQDVEMVQQYDYVSVSFCGGVGAWDEGRFLECARGSGPPCVGFVGRGPVEVSQDVEEASGGGTAFGKVVGLRGVDDALPEVVVGLCQDAVVDAGELSVDAKEAFGLDARVCGGLGVEDPAVRVGDEFVALEEGGWGRGGGVRGEEEEDIV